MTYIYQAKEKLINGNSSFPRKWEAILEMAIELSTKSGQPAAYILASKRNLSNKQMNRVINRLQEKQCHIVQYFDVGALLAAPFFRQATQHFL